MSYYRIVCAEFSGTSHGGQGHIVAVGTGDGQSAATNRQTVETVRYWIRNGDTYYTVSPSTGKVALVHPYDCWCGVNTLRSAADALTDNNLDNMRLCRWKQAV